MAKSEAPASLDETRHAFEPVDRHISEANANIGQRQLWAIGVASFSLNGEAGRLMGVEGGQHVFAEPLQLLHEHLVGHRPLVEVQL